MAKKSLAKEQIVKLIVGAGQASPSPPVGPALGSKGVKSMDFCKVCTYSEVLGLLDATGEFKYTELGICIEGLALKLELAQKRAEKTCAYLPYFLASKHIAKTNIIPRNSTPEQRTTKPEPPSLPSSRSAPTGPSTSNYALPQPLPFSSTQPEHLP
jgi:hypothetical protein